MTEFDRGSFGERMTMVCAVCGSNHHGNNAEVFVRDQKTGVVRRARCPLCCCLDCVQLSSDPIRTQLRPLIMGQTLQSQYNLEVEELKKGMAGPVKRMLNIKAPGPLNLQDAMSSIQGLLGLQPAASSKRHRIGQATGCGCGKNAVSKCIACDVPLCMKCLKSHDCE